MYRTGPQLVQSVGVGVLAEQQHSIGHQLPYKQRGLHWLQLKPFTQSTVAHMGSFSWVQLVSMLGDPVNILAFQKLPRSLLISWCLTPQAGAMDLVPESPSVMWSWRIHRYPEQKGFKTETGVVGAGVLGHCPHWQLQTGNRRCYWARSSHGLGMGTQLLSLAGGQLRQPWCLCKQGLGRACPRWNGQNHLEWKEMH